MKKSEALNILGLSEGASEEDIKKAHRKKVIENHPDRFQDPDEKTQAEERTKRINEARDVLEKGTWDPEFSSTPYNRPYGNPYGNPYRGGTSQQDGSPFGFDPNFWAQWEQDSRGNSAGSGQHGYDPFNNPFASAQSSEQVKEREKALTRRDMRMGFIMLGIKVVICGALTAQGAWLAGAGVWALLSLFTYLSHRVGNMGGCLWLILLPLFMYLPSMLNMLVMGQSSIGIIVAVMILFVAALVYDIRDLVQSVRRWRVASGKKSPGEKFDTKRREAKEKKE